ncbi:hypothetical protein TNCV_3332551 [Trichonephila clavipes]|nr:hypothetical protein TNCV_3332551 [Trichonephila clavipes]
MKAKAKAYLPISIYVTDAGVHMQMFRSSGQSDAKPTVFSSQESLILIYRPKAESTLRSPGFEPRTCGVDDQYSTTQPLGFNTK